MTLGAFGVTLGAFGMTRGALGVAWGSLGMSWDAQWSPKEALILLQARFGRTKGSPREPQVILRESKGAPRMLQGRPERCKVRPK